MKRRFNIAADIKIFADGEKVRRSDDNGQVSDAII